MIDSGGGRLLQTFCFNMRRPSPVAAALTLICFAGLMRIFIFFSLCISVLSLYLSLFCFFFFSLPFLSTLLISLGSPGFLFLCSLFSVLCSLFSILNSHFYLSCYVFPIVFLLSLSHSHSLVHSLTRARKDSFHRSLAFDSSRQLWRRFQHGF